MMKNVKNQMHLLSKEMMEEIFLFDSTFREKWHWIMNQIRNIPWRNTRLVKEQQRMIECRVVEYGILWITVVYRNKHYRIFLPPDYPLASPIAYLDTQRLADVDWLPTATLETLVISYDTWKDPVQSECKALKKLGQIQ
jgi:hypothetical protein